ncbi:GAF domain-containing protein [Hypnocyclicus thermotrophus]|uniref:GAF domain-containing protein n=1 Tax=Hypnocyclicus thermotrophus TaxID=1627895 RepID=A0AA46DX00_9FUSO|nr:HD domain-containing phosphohydrolase [Hypnocyclicus thermotrophus]TDT67351.1 GAF domain-containing protein [Hypnocyclicus thermotrophus]
MELDYKKLLNDLIKIAISLSAERDIEKLLNIILKESMRITCSDGGSIYVKETDEKGKDYLRFAITHNVSRKIDFNEFTLPLDRNSIAGYVGFSKKTLILKNVNNIDENIGLKYNSSFDEKINYQTVNMLVIPMLDYNHELVGVLQLINKKSDYNLILEKKEEIRKQILEYNKIEAQIISSLASQAAILIERTKLYNSIENLLQSFIESMVMTLEKRDNTTSGHSRRLAGYALKFLETVSKVNYGKYAYTKYDKNQIKEIYYAALLHDIGKIGVKEYILQKRDRLTEDRINVIKYRYKYFREILSQNGEIEKIKKYDEYIKFIEETNKKGYLQEEEEEKLKEIYNEKIKINEKEEKIIDEFEYKNLSIKRGNLTDKEREEMIEHVVYSKEILDGIKWTKQLKNVPIIAGGHHEKIDGSGYPLGLKGDEITTQAKILAILDIFEALTARDRPYKPPMSVDKAISILKKEVEANHLEKDLLDIFLKEKIYELYKEELDKIIKL